MKPTLSTDYLKSFHKNGSWPYFPGNTPAIEPTVVCSLACREDDSICEGALDYLFSSQNPDGGWSSGKSLGPSDWNTGLALMAIARLSKELKRRKKLSKQLEEKSAEVYKSSLSRLIGLRADIMPNFGRAIATALEGPEFDYARGWPWEEKTWHWVEPTAYSLLAIKASEEPQEKRIAAAVAQAHNFLFRNTLKDGGWNWGQVRTFAFDFPAVPRDTAIALLALQDQTGHEQVKKALQILRGAAGGGTELPDPLVLLALNAHGDDVSESIKTLVTGYKQPEYGGENLVNLAYAACAAELENKGNPFKMNAVASATHD